MTTWYFDGDNGVDGDDGTSEETAKKSYQVFFQQHFGESHPGDTFLFKRGTTQTITEADIGIRSGLSDTQRTRYGAYGEATVPYSFWVNPSGVGNKILNAGTRNYVDFEDMYLDGKGACLSSLNMLASGANACTNIRIFRCLFTNMTTNSAGLQIGASPTSTGDTGNFVIEDSHFFANAGHGLLLNGVHDAVIRRCSFFKNGFDATSGAHGFSAKARRTAASGTWTQIGTTSVYKYALTPPQETDVYYVKTDDTTYRRLKKITDNPTSPAIGEFGVSGGYLYINIGGDPATQGVNYAYGRCYNITVEDCESYNNISDTDPEIGIEGHGFAFDDYTDTSIFRLNRSHNNQGVGFSINLGDNNIVDGNLAYRNDIQGIACATGKNTIVTNNTFFGNNVGDHPGEGEIYIFKQAEVTVTNNILKSKFPKSSYAVDNDTDIKTIVSGSKNAAYGYDNVIHYTSALSDTIQCVPGYQGLLRQAML
jgi:parallel beta-helix repeat protein